MCGVDKKWSSLPDNLAVEYRKTAPVSFRRLWFHNLNLNRAYIVQFTRLRLGHNRFSSRVFKLGLSDSPLCPRHDEEQICNLSHIIFVCPDFNNPRASFLLRLHSLGVPLDTVNILCSTTRRVVFS